MYYINTHTLFTNFGGSYLSWEANLAYTLGGILPQFPRNFALFVISPKKRCRSLNLDKKMFIGHSGIY